MKIDVMHNARRNITFGVINKIVLLVLPFVSKYCINAYLGAEYLGLNSLFGSILSVLSLTELGISSALVYHMYKPIAEDDTKTLCALLNFYKQAYRVIGLITTVIGIVIIPFIPLLINGEYPEAVNIYIIYTLQLLSNCLGYFMAGYKQSLLVAYQREDINSIINLLTQGGMQLVQLVLILVTRNYYLYSVCVPIFTVANNLWIFWITEKMFPDLKCKGTLAPDLISNIKKLVAGSFVQKACAVTRNSIDSMCVSAFVGLVLTGIYNNYYSIFNGITVLLTILVVSLTGGIGNHVAIKTKSENFEELKIIDFLYLCLAGWCTCCLLCLTQPFMKLWMGDKMLLSQKSVIFMCIYFYLLKMGDVRSLYYSTTGMWWEMRYRSIVETICNLALNILLGYYFGINGIILATVFSLFICNFIWGSRIVFQNYFGIEKLKEYYCYHAKYFGMTVFVCGVTWYAASKIHVNTTFIELIIKAFLCLVIPAVIYYVAYQKTKVFKEAIKILKQGKN